MHLADGARSVRVVGRGRAPQQTLPQCLFCSWHGAPAAGRWPSPPSRDTPPPRAASRPDVQQSFPVLPMVGSRPLASA